MYKKTKTLHYIRIYVSSLATLTSLLTLAGCGSSSPPDESVAGSLSGLTESGLVLEFNGMSLSVPAGTTSQPFGSIAAGSNYSVTVTTQPTQETCTVNNGSGTVPRAAVNVSINCALNTYSIGGAVTGLTEPGLVLLNNGVDATQVKPNATTFAMDTPVTSGGAYAITINAQPAGETCAVSSESGNNVLANVTTVAIQCAPWTSAAVTTQYSFTGGTDGNSPSILLQGADSNFYGIAAGTPYVSNGTVYQVTLAGAENTLYTFAGVYFGPPLPEGPDGLIQGTDGNLYGTAFAGGSANEGAFFKLDLAGTLTTLHSFTGGSDGAVPTGRLLQAPDGSFSGTTLGGGGSNNNGAIFEVSTTGAESVLFDMPPTSTNAASPALLLAHDGTTYYASAFNSTTPGGGTVYAVSPDGTGRPVYAFNGGSEGSQIGALLEGPDGNLYGFTASGGTVGGGTAFELTPSGTLTTLYSFGNTNDGDTPSSLIIGNDGNFYGTTSKGGVSGFGTIFRLTPAGSETVFYSFTGGSDGTGPTNLIQASDGNFYGLTINGGIDGVGAIFKAVPH